MSRGRRAPETGRLIPPEPSVVDLHTHTGRSDGLPGSGGADVVGAVAAHVSAVARCLSPFSTWRRRHSKRKSQVRPTQSNARSRRRPRFHF